MCRYGAAVFLMRVPDSQTPRKKKESTTEINKGHKDHGEEWREGERERTRTETRSKKKNEWMSTTKRKRVKKRKEAREAKNQELGCSRKKKWKKE